MLEELHNDPEIVSLGRMAVFLVPASKMRKEWAPTEGEVTSHTKVFGVTEEERLDRELIKRYQGVTKVTANVEGSYRLGGELIREDHIRYEVSFLGPDKVLEFVQLLKELCRKLNEDSIYLTMGENSYLVKPKGAKP